MKISYGIDLDLKTLGYQPGNQDPIVFSVQSELNMYTTNAKDAMKIWKWDPKALKPEDHYRIDQLLRMYVFQRDQVLAALKRLDREVKKYAESNNKVKQELDSFKAFLLKDIVEECKPLYKLTEGKRKAILAGGEGAVAAWDRYVTSAENSTPKAGLPESLQPRYPSVAGVIAFRHPAVSRYLGRVPSLEMGGLGGVFFRLTDSSYPRKWITDEGLYNQVDMALALQAELQLQCLLTDREFTRIIQTRGMEFEYLKAESARKAAEESSSFWAKFGDIAGIVSAVAGVLALIPVLTPIAGPVAAVTAVAALGSHTVDASIKGDWDAMTIVGLGADALAALPAIGAVAKSLKSGKAVLKTIGTGSKASYRASVAVRRAGLTFLAETGGAGASEATAVANYLGTKGAKALQASEKAGKYAGKVLQGSVNLGTQIPLAVEMATREDMSDPKNAATSAALVANYGQSIGSWGAVGTAAQKAGTRSLATFGRIISRL